ncbi:hypothetical protein COW36_09570 [bacterium (Candidatus Blackallbacteria) CG17_big_fil_post_rev_8_21_14_2_50_48_46]|uniref:Uncharacterized protein n=1 Tax=bacterium (Candidatus Blackallbacteria) CG17_big_fil_post_rev_8_21_14_2_50_48_46 TaxID=2014261 RepID=A0A2M7G6F6_9BACT|nr:MAG: hypothetical protein COW64_01840 [bacterium (Candidatus Blackallbacteria) CG18_big_fil_WC_8_21_14_2_50_49_26]PIW17210.1 MAG: hypothetical protein COW36_09570 [bacterium (Candidatus Blackallbacteria) CG17_big_fil_post_rev_8_21_14_2_50_48_46]PIW51001.1 MAG: hypothetical protein COW20_00580 [bacterium (Candidatus Blackallbacteria) CG13_big_fil_rev_8_21_14_2_50_49_14]
MSEEKQSSEISESQPEVQAETETKSKPEKQKPTKKGGKLKWILASLLVLLLGVAGGLASFQVMQFKAKAEGLALGYAEAAVTAYQMDRYARPLPDRIFENGPYRVETKTHGTPPQLHISVRDRYLNMTHYELDRQFDVSGRPTPPPNEGQER